MILYRVSNHADLSGMGGELADGRWHKLRRGKRIVYLSDHPALCVLEMIAQIEYEEDLPDSINMFSLEIADNLLETLGDDALPDNWPNQYEATQGLGDTWLAERRSAGLLVPSVLIPVARNCLFNPLFKGVESLRLKSLGRFSLDPRIRRVR